MSKHLFYYLGLIAGISVAIITITSYGQQKQAQLMTVVILGMLYAGWGIMHHKLHHTLRPRIVLEYVAVAALGIAAILFLLRSVL